MSESSLPEYEFDVFISYASEDRADFVSPLFDALKEKGIRAWIDYGQIKVGDSLREKIDEGLARSRFGIVVLSQHSLDKFWTNLEWDALLAQEDATDSRRILPVTHGVTPAELASKSPTLGGRLSAASTDGVDAVVEQLIYAMQESPMDPSSTGGRPYGVRRSSNVFVGRTKDLERAKAAILQGNASNSASISGLAGIGKTALATELAYRLLKEGHFPGGVIWLDAESGDLTGGWSSDEVGGDLVPTASLAERAAKAVRYVSRLQMNVLIMLDNVVDWTEANRPKPLPQGTHVHLLMTTREAGLGGNSFKELRLDVLEPQEARELLLQTAGRDIEPGVDDLLEAFEGHALALELAGAFLKEMGTAEEYLDAVDLEPLEKEVSAQVRYERTTAGALSAVWDRLDEGGQLAWCIAAQFEPESVGKTILDATGVDATARRKLARYHLIQTIQGAKTGPRWRVHRLVRGYGQHSRKEGILGEAKDRFSDGILDYVHSIDLPTGFGPYKEERTHLEAVVAKALELDEVVDKATLLDRIATGRQSAGESESAAELYRAVLAAVRRGLGEEHPFTLSAMNNLAGTLTTLGDLAGARELQEKALEVRCRVLGEEHPSTLTSMSNLAVTLKAQGDLNRARGIEEKVLNVRRRVLGDEHPSTLVSMNNLADSLFDLGDLAGARELEEKVLNVRQRDLGKEHPITLTLMSNYAETLKAQGDLAGAMELQGNVLEVMRRELGKEHPSTVTSMNNLASTLSAQGDLTGARELQVKVLEVWRRILGEEHQSTLTSMSNLAEVLRDQGNLTGARELQEKVLEVRRRVFGEEHPSTITSKNNLAHTFLALGYRALAHELVTAAGASAQRVWGDENPNTKVLMAFLTYIESDA